MTLASQRDYEFVGTGNSPQSGEVLNPNNNRESEIINFCSELRQHKINCPTLKLIPKSKKIKDHLLEVAMFVVNIPSFLNDKLFPIVELKDHFRVSKRYLLKHKPYIIAVAILLNGPYIELKKYFLEANQ